MCTPNWSTHSFLPNPFVAILRILVVLAPNVLWIGILLESVNTSFERRNVSGVSAMPILAPATIRLSFVFPGSSNPQSRTNGHLTLRNPVIGAQVS